MKTAELERQLDSFAVTERRDALWQLVEMRLPPAPTGGNVNMHFHSFFSFNARGYSPIHLAWESHRQGLYAAGLCDFDVLDGQEEFLEAGLALGLRVTVNLETRAFLKEFADADINSPGEPGVTYLMGAGLVHNFFPSSSQTKTLAQYREQAGHRNRALVQRINTHVAPIAIDFDHHVMPLTPAGCPTERHIIRAYLTRANAVFAAQSALVEFWSDVLQKPTVEIAQLLTNITAFEENVRTRFVKKGGLGYEQPTVATFSPADEFIAWVRSCDGIPMATWLDGISRGEADPATMLDCLRAKGVAAVNIIPDRNWRIADPKMRALKTEKLREFVAAADRLRLPINIGTEMNKESAPFVDDMNGEALRPYQNTFLRGAQVLVGHSILARYAAYSYLGQAATAEFGQELEAKNKFFASVGALPPLTAANADRLLALGPERALAGIREAVKQGRWP